MSAINSIAANLPPFQPNSPIAGQSQPTTIAEEKTAAAAKAAATRSQTDADQDGDSDGPGLDVKA